MKINYDKAQRSEGTRKNLGFYVIISLNFDFEQISITGFFFFASA